jgi:tRNA-binding protein
MDVIEFSDWKKLRLKVGLVERVERVPKTKRLYKLQVNVGEDCLRQIVTSLVPYYADQELMGKKVIVLTNLASARFAGEISDGMLICAELGDHSECALLTVDKDIRVGTPVT